MICQDVRRTIAPSTPCLPYARVHAQSLACCRQHANMAQKDGGVGTQLDGGSQQPSPVELQARLHSRMLTMYANGLVPTAMRATPLPTGAGSGPDDDALWLWLERLPLHLRVKVRLACALGVGWSARMCLTRQPHRAYRPIGNVCAQHRVGVAARVDSVVW